mmetsp:Transcript_96310/g.272302  ORF Transcript_96310/g.272302 Transcript_96310/m.272302 type:complete len:235 (+) Transcript_96310:2277-2981(+)
MQRIAKSRLRAIAIFLALGACGVRMRRQERCPPELLVESLQGGLHVLFRRLCVFQRHRKPCAIHQEVKAILGAGDGVRSPTVPREERAQREARQGAFRRLALGCRRRLRWPRNDRRSSRGGGAVRRGSVARGSVGDFPVRLALLALVFLFGGFFAHSSLDLRRSLTTQHGEERIRFLKVVQDGDRLLGFSLQEAQLEQQEANLDGEEIVNRLNVFKELLQDKGGLRVLAELQAQ